MTTIICGKRWLRTLAVMAAILATGIAPAAQPHSDVSILYHESVILLDLGRSENGSLERIEFDAFGRRFVLRVDASAPGRSDPSMEMIKARIDGERGSWARLSLSGGTLAGLIRDRNETYAIESRRNLEGELMLASPADGSQSIIYRLSDTLVPAGLLACDTHGESGLIDGKTALASLTAELSTTATLAAVYQDRATVGVLADYTLFDRLGTEVDSTIDQMFLTVDGLYSSQVGIAIDLSEVRISNSPAEDPLGNQRIASEILEELGQWRKENQSHLAITHLLTNRRLQNSENELIAGISFLGSPGRSGVCDARTGASMSEWISTPMTALVIAHEIGHNFGAPHDGEVPEPGEKPNPCVNEPQDVYLMSPLLRSTSVTEFSQCSLGQMERVIEAANCLRATDQQLASTAAGEGGGALHWPTVLLLAVIAGRRRIRRAVRTSGAACRAR